MLSLGEQHYRFYTVPEEDAECSNIILEDGTLAMLDKTQTKCTSLKISANWENTRVFLPHTSVVARMCLLGADKIYTMEEELVFYK